MSKTSEQPPNQPQGLKLALPRFFSQVPKGPDSEMEKLKLEITKLNKENADLKFTQSVMKNTITDLGNSLSKERKANELLKKKLSRIEDENNQSKTVFEQRDSKISNNDPEFEHLEIDNCQFVKDDFNKTFIYAASNGLLNTVKYLLLHTQTNISYENYFAIISAASSTILI
jgi:hypothetical protein